MKTRLDCAVHVLEHDVVGTCMSYHEAGRLIKRTCGRCVRIEDYC